MGTLHVTVGTVGTLHGRNNFI